MLLLTKNKLLCLVSLLLLGCANTPPMVSDTNLKGNCYFPYAPDKQAPKWICTGNAEQIEFTAVGMAEKSVGGISFMKQMAATSARTELAQRIKVRVSNMVKQYAETTGMGKAQTVDTVRTAVTKQITTESLQGTRIYKSMIGPKGAMYVLVGIDKEKSRYLVENAIKSSMNTDAAIWQQWRSKLAQEELAKEISKIELK